MRNPLKEIKEKNGWSIQEFVSVTGLGFSTVYNCLTGNTQNINQRILETLEQLGYDTDKVEKEYQEFRVAKQKELMQEAI